MPVRRKSFWQPLVLVIGLSLLCFTPSISEAQIFKRKGVVGNSQYKGKPSNASKSVLKKKVRPKSATGRMSNPRQNRQIIGGRNLNRKPRSFERNVAKKNLSPRSASGRLSSPSLNKRITSGVNLKKSPRNASKYVRKRNISPRSASGRRSSAKQNQRITSGSNLNKNPRDAEKYVLKKKSKYGRSPSPYERGKTKADIVKAKRHPTPGSTYVFGTVNVKRPGKSPSSSYKGSMAVTGRPQKGRGSTFQGYIRVSGKYMKQRRSPASTYTGTMVYRKPRPGPGQQYGGSMSFSKNQNRRLDRQRFAYSGNMRVKKQSRGLFAYLAYYFSNRELGFAKDPYDYKKSQRKIYAYSGNMKYRKPAKRAHPSSNYRNNINNNFLVSREGMRKTNVWWNRLFKNQDQPPDVRKSLRSPRYDKKENEIWNE
jgi:hypothetical protein